MHQLQVTQYHPSLGLDSTLSSELTEEYRGGDDSQFSVFLNEPSPATSLYSGKSAIEWSLEFI